MGVSTTLLTGIIGDAAGGAATAGAIGTLGAGAGAIAGFTPIATGITAADVAAGVGIASSVYGTVLGGRRPVIPPSPVMDQSQIDQSEQQAQADAMKRQSIAGGIQSTIGTSEAGAMLNPANLQQHTLLGQ